MATAAGASPMSEQEARAALLSILRGVLGGERGARIFVAGFYGGEGDGSWEEGKVPAAKPAVEALKTVEVMDSSSVCSVCLDGLDGGERVVKELPCRHRFHQACIEKWLGMQGNCPMCRHELPKEEAEKRKKEGVFEIVEIVLGGSPRGDGGEGRQQQQGRDEAEDLDDLD